MGSENDSTIQAKAGTGPSLWSAWFQENAIQIPGLTGASREIHSLVQELSKNLAVFSYKQHMPCLWVVFVGGTGTGKSTLFNAFCGKALSATGVERPKTVGPVLYAYRGCPVERRFPFESVQVQRWPQEQSDAGPATGGPGHMLIMEHERDDLSHLVVVDTPDLDSVEVKNREMAEDLYRISDAVVFVTSQEKYADDVPYQFFLRIMQDKKPCFFLLNKMQDPLTREEVLLALQSQGISSVMERVWLIPYASVQPYQQVCEDPAFGGFRDTFIGELSSDRAEALQESQHRWRAEILQSQVDRLLALLEQEDRAAGSWLAELDALCKATCHDLITEEKKGFTAESRKHIQREIRRLFAKYDVLAKPRRFIREIFLSPLRVFGFYLATTKDGHKNALSKVRERIDFAPVISAVEKFNRLALETLSPADETAPVFKALRQPGVVLTDEEIKARVWREQDLLHVWLQETFQTLSRGLSKQKRWGIYSTSVLWGILILSFEIAVGGGFTVIDAVLDSALAPFVTRGAVELFAYHEIQKTARELAQRYKRGLLSVVDYQREKYRQCLGAFMAPEKTIEALRRLQSHIRDWEFEPVKVHLDR
jgi:GTPase SAR1 family protein